MVFNTIQIKHNMKFRILNYKNRIDELVIIKEKTRLNHKLNTHYRKTIAELIGRPYKDHSLD